MKQIDILTFNYQINPNLELTIDNLSVNRGDKIGLIGNNGSGKTTLLHLLAQKISLETPSVQHYLSVTLVKQFKDGFDDKSGGEKTQRYLQEAFKQDSVWLLDEPTTHLDNRHVDWVEKQVLNHHEGIVVVSHDRHFLNQVCNKIWLLKDGKITVYKGNYQSFLTQYEEQEKRYKENYDIYQREKKGLEQAIRAKKQQANGAMAVPKNKKQAGEKVGSSKPYYAKKQKKLDKSAKALETRLSKLERVEAPKKETSLTMETSLSHMSGEHIMIRGMDVSAEINHQVLFSQSDFYIKNREKVAIVGDNGVGKTTLLKMMLDKESSIKVSPSIEFGYFSQEVDLLDDKETVLENVLSSMRDHNQTLARTVLARMHFFDRDIEKTVSVLSGGERVKVTLAKLLLSDINTLVLDEPTNYLDIEAIRALEALLQAFEGTVIFVSHDREFINSVATKLLIIENKKINVFEGPLSDYKITPIIKKNSKQQDSLLVIETKISEILGKLSLEPSEELEQEFQLLLKQKQVYKKTHKS
ncbi:ribosomal protection-like ABC-F family protein [Melissococcus sp. OM08-11BH]|uniref:ribosomal protection-like ABC-F family protein n=1 Tax=Melissococcus sp. OM08-11BH TaxID=2293110 RepID=UPI000E4FED61|nr:ABC-F family ATP-binding cassette domain-containing protein [Melissococcus sp. OM08-11BH]RGI31908.1 ABC transporter ATP-binding protein [Melissococcus sp. OM08-11BH]